MNERLKRTQRVANAALKTYIPTSKSRRAKGGKKGRYRFKQNEERAHKEQEKKALIQVTVKGV